MAERREGDRPQLSVVVTSRNDDHGGHLLERMRYFVHGLADQAARHAVAVELVLVEWNPPDDRPSLGEAMPWPSTGALEVRIVTVPTEWHRRLKGASALGLFQMIAKNVGIRRARGDFVLATNVDIVFSEPLFGCMAGPLKEGTLYRADRHDVVFDVADPANGFPELRQACARPRRVVTKDGVHYPGRGRVIPTYQGVADAARTLGRRLVTPGPSPVLGPEQRPSHGGERSGSGSVVAVTRDRLDALVALLRLPKLHVNACGDFTLLSRRDWLVLRGYPEWQMFSWNLDSVLLYKAHADGLGFVELPGSMPAFHIEQATGSAWTPEGRDELFARVERQGLRYVSDRDLRRLATRIRGDARRGARPRFNGPDWGLAAVDLPEEVVTQVARASTDR